MIPLCVSGKANAASGVLFFPSSSSWTIAAVVVAIRRSVGVVQLASRRRIAWSGALSASTRSSPHLALVLGSCVLHLLFPVPLPKWPVVYICKCSDGALPPDDEGRPPSASSVGPRVPLRVGGSLLPRIHDCSRHGPMNVQISRSSCKRQHKVCEYTRYWH